MVSNPLTNANYRSGLIRTEVLVLVPVCPHCAASAMTTARAVDARGRVLRCMRCGTMWLVGREEDRQSVPFDGPQPEMAIAGRGRPRFKRIIEHIDDESPTHGASASVAPHRRSPILSWLVRRGQAAKAGMASIAVLLLLSLTVMVLEPRGVGASSAEDMTGFEGLQIRLVRAALVPGRGGMAVSVEGEIKNQTLAAIKVPAVRVSVRSQGIERHAWVHEPGSNQLAGGQSVFFQTVLENPPRGIDEAAFRLTRRDDTRVGAR